MPEIAPFLTFGLVAFGMALSPGPNMVYLLSRSICQGRKAGFISLCGVLLAFVFYIICTALGITALVMVVPFAYNALRFGGALYLLYLAWQAIKPGGRSPFQVRDLSKDGNRRLFLMGFLTNLLNPKAAVMYVSLLPQFINPENNVFAQTMMLGLMQSAISFCVNGLVVLTAGSMAAFFTKRVSWLVVQRWLMSSVLTGLAVRMALETTG